VSVLKVSQPNHGVFYARTTINGMNGTRSRATSRVVLLLFSAVTTIASVQFSTATPSLAQETQAHGYWVDHSTGLMWAAKDNGKDVTWRKGKKYCRDLRLAGFSDWRLATIDELESLIDMSAFAPTRVGNIGYLHFNMKLEVHGGLLLTGQSQWSNSQIADDRGKPSGYVWRFDYVNVRRNKEDAEILFGGHAHAICVRDAKTTASPP
jgi:hypothetical protein